MRTFGSWRSLISDNSNITVQYRTFPTASRAERRHGHAGAGFAMRAYNFFQAVAGVQTFRRSRQAETPVRRAVVKEVFATNDTFDGDSGGFALHEGSSHVYNEEAFHYFLEIERKRSE